MGFSKKLPIAYVQFTLMYQGIYWLYLQPYKKNSRFFMKRILIMLFMVLVMIAPLFAEGQGQGQ